jgi:uncharacterized membrane protein YoaK (UPF0700 family)
LALASGAVDALSVSVLGVFTAAITANVVFVGLALGDGDPHSALRAALAIAGFALGVLAGARGLRRGRDGGRARAPLVLAGIALAQSAFLVAWVAADGRPEGATLDLLAVASALAMGGQTAVAVRWRPDVTTTYVTGTLTVLIGELVESSGTRSDRARQASVIGAVAGGAAAGALLLAHARSAAAALPLAITLLTTAGAFALARRRRPDARSA